MKPTIWIVSIAFTLNVIEATVIPDEHYANTEQERLYTRSADAHNLMEGDASGLSLGNSDIQSSLTKRAFGRGRPRRNHFQRPARRNPFRRPPRQHHHQQNFQHQQHHQQNFQHQQQHFQQPFQQQQQHFQQPFQQQPNFQQPAQPIIVQQSAPSTGPGFVRTGANALITAAAFRVVGTKIVPSESSSKEEKEEGENGKSKGGEDGAGNQKMNLRMKNHHLARESD
ncbi:hypothetical protein BASA81_012874 [Batrachochytrium salamandrivorans]|nr:hypothetical protein BASA81_012874 [Batrachochytrium salamandrivorans]